VFFLARYPARHPTPQIFIWGKAGVPLRGFAWPSQLAYLDKQYGVKIDDLRIKIFEVLHLGKMNMVQRKM